MYDFHLVAGVWRLTQYAFAVQKMIEIAMPPPTTFTPTSAFSGEEGL
jgi:hypothetical protein